MIGIFVKAGDPEVGNHFLLYQKEFRDIVHRNVFVNNYGEGIDLILIQFHLEGRFLQIPDEQYKVNYFRKKEKSASVNVYVPMTFQFVTEREKKEFISKTTTEAVLIIKKRMEKKENIHINFDQLLQDLEKSTEEYLSSVKSDD